MELVTVSGNQVVTTTTAIAEGTEVEHASVIKLVRTYKNDLEEFGRVGFQIQPFETGGGTQTREVAELNEHQATLLLTYMRNSEIVRGFKKRLVSEFFRMRDKLNAKPTGSHAQMLVLMAQQFLAVEQEQQRQSTEIARIQETVAVIEARTQPENRHFTVLGYSNLIGKKLDFKTASKLGKKCAELSRKQGLPIGDVKDPRFGNVHSYHESILNVVMTDSGDAYVH